MFRKVFVLLELSYFLFFKANFSSSCIVLYFNLVKQRNNHLPRQPNPSVLPSVREISFVAFDVRFGIKKNQKRTHDETKQVAVYFD